MSSLQKWFKLKRARGRQGAGDVDCGVRLVNWGAQRWKGTLGAVTGDLTTRNSC